jgi:hypothetical protein
MALVDAGAQLGVGHPVLVLIPTEVARDSGMISPTIPI